MQFYFRETREKFQSMTMLPGKGEDKGGKVKQKVTMASHRALADLAGKLVNINLYEETPAPTTTTTTDQGQDKKESEKEKSESPEEKIENDKAEVNEKGDGNTKEEEKDASLFGLGRLRKSFKRKKKKKGSKRGKRSSKRKDETAEDDAKKVEEEAEQKNGSAAPKTKKVNKKTAAVMGRTRAKLFGANTFAKKGGKGRGIKTRSVILAEEVAKERDKAVDAFIEVRRAIIAENANEEEAAYDSKAMSFYKSITGRGRSKENKVDEKSEEVGAGDAKVKDDEENAKEARRKDYDRILAPLTCEKVRSALSKLQYFEDGDVDVVAKVLAGRVAAEGLDVSEQEVRWLVVCFMADFGRYDDSAQELAAMFASRDQAEWMPAYLATQLNETVKVEAEDEEGFIRQCRVN